MRTERGLRWALALGGLCLSLSAQAHIYVVFGKDGVPAFYDHQPHPNAQVYLADGAPTQITGVSLGGGASPSPLVPVSAATSVTAAPARVQSAEQAAIEEQSRALLERWRNGGSRLRTRHDD